MKKFGKKFLASLLAVAQIITFTPISNLTAFAANTATDGNGTDDAQGISSTFSDGVLTISHIDGKSNSTISSNRLWSDVKDDITKVVIGEGITVVGMGFGNTNADEACKNLTTVELPKSLTDISNNAFANCTSLTDVDFSKCTNLKHINGVKFNSNHTNLSNGDGEKNEFLNCTALTRIDLSNCTKLERIWSSGFEGCTNLEEVILPSTTQMIGQKTFKDCSKLTTINIPDSLIYISQNAFQADTALTNIDLNKVETIKESAFIESGLTEIDLPESLTYVEQFAFNQCNNLQKISGGQGIQDNLTNNKKDATYKHNGNDILKVSTIFMAQVTYDGSPLYPYPEDNFQSSSETKEMIYTNVDDAVDCIKYGNWRLAHRYQFKLRFIDATHTIFDTDKVFDGYTGYFDYYNDTVKAADVNNQISNVPVKYEKANAAFVHYYRDENYAVHTKDGKTYTPSDKWTSGKTGPEVDLTRDTQILSDIDYYLTKYDTDTVTHTVKFKNIKGKDTVEQTYNDGEHLTNIPTDLNYSDTNYNYTFVGWSTTISEDDIVTVDETVTVTEDKEYYAIYEQTDKLTLKYVYTTMTDDYPDCDNPFSLDSTKYLKDERDYDNAAVGQKLGSTYEDAPATLTKDDKTYDFVGWYAYYYTGNGGFKTITINADTKISKDNISTDRHNGNSIVYYAIYKYNPKKYMVSFINEDNTSENKSGEVESGNTYANTYNGFDDVDEYFVPTSAGKTFKGWKVNDTAEIVSTKDAIDRVITEDTTFIATFEDNIVNLTFRFFDADNAPIKTSTVMQLSTTFADIPKPDSNPTKEGYTFKGWRAETDIVKDSDVFSEDTDFYPVFEENAPTEYTLRFILQNADGNYVWKTDKVKAGNSYTLPTRDEINPLRFETTDGKTYEFLRWTKKGSAAYLDAVITPTSDMDFYAEYREIHFYTVTLLNDDNSVITTEKVESSNYFTYDSTPTSKVNAEDKYFGYWKRTEGTSGSNTIFNSINIKVYDNVTYQAVYYDVHYVTIKFVDAEGNELNSVTMKEGNKITASDIPTKKANGNDILGWRFGITNDKILNTTFSTDRTYEAVPNITFKKKDGSTIKTVAATFNREKDYYDATQVEVPSDISRWTLDGTEYTSSEITDGEHIKNIKKDLVFEETVAVQPTIKIIFVDDDETTVLKTEKVYALGILFNQLDAPSVSNKEDDVYTYTFKGWRVKGETDLVNESRGFNTDTILVAVYDKVAKPVTPVESEKVTARFINWNNDDLGSREVVKGTTLGEIVIDTPSRDEDDNFTYTFKAWTVNDNEVDDTYVINEDTTFKATYTSTPKQTTPVDPDPDVTVTVTFKPENGEADTVKTDVVSGSALGTVKIADPVKAEDDKFTYTFAGWKLEENDAVVDDSYVINKDTVFIATYTATRKTYHVIFKDEDGTTIDEKDVPTNTPLGDIKPNDPSKEGKDFKGWDDGTGIKPDDTPITKDTTFTATYEPKELPPTPTEPEKVTVIFKDYDGTTVEEKQVNKNSFLGTVKPENPTRTDYKFVGWSKDDVVRDDGFIITEDTVFIATYVTKEIKLIQIDGTLLDKDGKPIANAVVTLHSTVRQTTTDENGYYIFKNVELEEHEVNAKVENTEVYKYNIDATDVENVKKVLESQDANYDVNSNISEKNGVVTITLNAKEKGNDTPAPSPVEPTPEPIIPTPEPVIPTPTPVQPKETVTIKFYLDYDLTELFDTVVVNKGEAFTYNKEPEGYKFWINVDQYAENRVYHNGETIYPMKDMTFYMEKEIIDTPDDSEVIDKPTDEPKNDDTPIKDNPKDNKDVPTPKDNKDKDKPKDKKDNPKEDKEKKEDRDIPKTGDSVLIYVLGLIAGLAMLKKKKEND